MVRLTFTQAQVLRALASLSHGNQQWFQTAIVLQERMGDGEYNRGVYFSSTEKILFKLSRHVPRLVERRIVKSGFSWCLTVAGRAWTETQLEEE